MTISEKRYNDQGATLLLVLRAKQHRLESMKEADVVIIASVGEIEWPELASQC